MDDYRSKYLKYKYKYQSLLDKFEQIGGSYLYDEFKSIIAMEHFQLDKITDSNYTLKSKKEAFVLDDVKKLTSGLSGDNVYSLTLSPLITGDKEHVRSILKIFTDEDNAKAECESINMFDKIGLGNHFSKIRLYGKIINISKLYEGDTKSYYFIISDFIKNVSMQDIISSHCCKKNKSLEIEVLRYCRKYYETDTNEIYNAINYEKNKIGMILLQIFYIIYTLKTHGISHCDLHGDNILITTIDEPFYIKMFDKKYKILEFKVVIIDLDTVSNVRIDGDKYVLCPGWKSNRSGVSKRVGKSNDLLIAYGKEYSKYTIKSIPVYDQIDARLNPVDGDMWHFMWILKILNDTYNFNIDMVGVGKCIDMLNQHQINLNIKIKDRPNLISYYTEHLYKLKELVFSQNSININEFELESE